MTRRHHRHRSKKRAQKEETLKVQIIFSPAPDAQERLRKLATLLLGPPVAKNESGAEPRQETQRPSLHTTRDEEQNEV